MSDLRETTSFAILCNKLLQKYGKNINKSANYFTDGPYEHLGMYWFLDKFTGLPFNSTMATKIAFLYSISCGYCEFELICSLH